MKKFSFLLFLFLLVSSMAHAVTYVYKGRSTYSSDILFTWDGKYLYAGRSTYSSDVILTFDGKYIYAGRSTYSSDILGTWPLVSSPYALLSWPTASLWALPA